MASKKRMNAVAVALGRRIASLRVDAGLTQEALAARLGSSKSVLSRVETGQRIPSVERLVEIAEIVGAELRDLFDSAVAGAKDSREADIAEIAALLRRRPPADASRALDVIRAALK